MFASIFLLHKVNASSTLCISIIDALPLFIEAASKHDVKGSDAWDSLTQIIDFLTGLLTVTSQIALISNLSRSAGGPIFAIICLIKPIVNLVFTSDLWDKGAYIPHFRTFKHDDGSLYHLFIVWFGYVDNEDRKRMDALRALADDKYRQDILSNNLGEWIISGQYFILL